MRSTVTKEIILEKWKLGITSPSQLARELGVERTTIFRRIQALKAAGLLDEIHAHVDYQRFSKTPAWMDAFPTVKLWADNMKFRDVRKWKEQLAAVKRFCDVLAITPDEISPSSFRQLVMDRAMVWWGEQKEGSKHGYRLAIRNYLMSRGFNIPRGMGKSIGLSGEKGNISKYAHIKLSDEEIEKVAHEIPSKIHRSLFRIGVLTCSRTSELVSFKPIAITESDGIATVAFFDKKNNKRRVKRLPTSLLEDYAEFWKGGYRLPNGPVEFRDDLRAAYRKIGLTEEYFYDHPIHTLRHVGAHYWLRRTNYSHSIVAKIGGWDSATILSEIYGDIPESVIENVVKGGLN